MTKAKEKKETDVEMFEGRPVLGRITGTEHLTEDGLGFPRLCKDVAIVGFAPSSMEDVQFLFGNQDVEIWPLNQLYVAWPRILPGNRIPERRNVTRWFQFHHRHTYDQTIGRDHSHHEWLTKITDFPIYMQKIEPDVPASCALPKDEILKMFPRRYFTNSISWMIALAIYEAYKFNIQDAKIYVYGVDMAQDCVAPDTKVLTSDLRWVAAGDIKVGDKVWAFPEDSENIMYNSEDAEVIEANRLVRPCKKITINGKDIISSDGHKWLTSTDGFNVGFTRTDCLEVGSLIVQDDNREVYSVTNIEDIGEQEVIGFKTSTKTFIAEGFASHNSEYAYERPSVEYFCGAVDSPWSPVRLVIPEKSDICKTMWLYPFEDTSPFRVKIEQRRHELRQRVQEAAQQEQWGHETRLQCIGALENMNYIERAWVNSSKDQGLIEQWGKKQ